MLHPTNYYMHKIPNKYRTGEEKDKPEQKPNISFSSLFPISLTFYANVDIREVLDVNASQISYDAI